MVEYVEGFTPLIHFSHNFTRRSLRTHVVGFPVKMWSEEEYKHNGGIWIINPPNAHWGSHRPPMSHCPHILIRKCQNVVWTSFKFLLYVCDSIRVVVLVFACTSDFRLIFKIDLGSSAMIATK